MCGWVWGGGWVGVGAQMRGVLEAHTHTLACSRVKLHTPVQVQLIACCLGLSSPGGVGP